ncbi:MAG: transketolase [Bacteroides sp.]
MEQHSIEEFAFQLRRDVVMMIAWAGSGHLGGCLSSADILATLFAGGFLTKKTIRGREVYPFILSAGHLAPLLYAALARRGEFPTEELETLREFGSHLQGHPSIGGKHHPPTPGLFAGSGSLGQGLSIAAGAAYALREQGDNVFVLLGDGELQEGQIWEGAMFAAHHKLRNLVAIVDWNGQQLDGSNEEVMCLGDLPAKWRAFGWEVIEEDGHNCSALCAALQKNSERPKVILAHTVMGKGIPEIENQSLWHGKAPSQEECHRFLGVLQTTRELVHNNKVTPCKSSINLEPLWTR